MKTKLYITNGKRTNNMIVTKSFWPRKIDNWGGTYSYIRVHRL